jgi:hypothetical protein
MFYGGEDEGLHCLLCYLFRACMHIVKTSV